MMLMGTMVLETVLIVRTYELWPEVLKGGYSRVTVVIQGDTRRLDEMRL